MKQPRVLLLSTLLVVASACGSGETESTTDTIATLETTTSTIAASTTTTTEAPNLEEVALEFTQCMRDNGVDMPDITFDADGQPVISGALAEEFDLFDAEVQTALSTCRGIFAEAGEGVELQLDPELIAEVTDQLTEWAVCMRDNGVENWPDPLPTFSGTEIPFPMAEMAAAFNDPEFADAMEACEDLVAFPGIGG
jgi:hypothetical protein